MIEARIQDGRLADGRVPGIASRGNEVDKEATRRIRETTLRGEINRLLARPDGTRRTLQSCTDAIVNNLDVVFARIWTLDRGHRLLKLEASSGLYTGLHGAYSRIPVGHLKIGLIAETRIPYLTNSVAGDPRVPDQEWVKREGIVAFAGYPLVVDDRVTGVIAVFARHPIESETLETLGSIAGIVAQGIERQRSQRELRRAIKANDEAVLGERTRIAREMHDGLLQNVTGIALQLRALLPRLRSAPEDSATALERILELAEQTSTDARLAVVGMRHLNGSDAPVTALQCVVERTLEGTAVALSVTLRGSPRAISPRVFDTATLILQQAVTNVVRHAQARNVQLAMNFGIQRLRISVRDDGRGFVPDRSTNGTTHFGLLGMHERAREIGARVGVHSELERGTTVSILLPYRAK